MKFYHGTRHAFVAGDKVEPGKSPANYSEGWNDTEVWLTTRLDEAWRWAEAARGDGDPRVFEVEPSDDPENWAELNGWDDAQWDEWITPAASVLAEVTA